MVHEIIYNNFKIYDSQRLQLIISSFVNLFNFPSYVELKQYK